MSYPMRLKHAREAMERQLTRLQIRVAGLRIKHDQREPHQDDEDDTLLIATQHVITAIDAVKRAGYALDDES